MDPNTELLTVEECAAVDAALLTAHGKFNARVAIYALRSLKQIAIERQQPIEDIQPATITAWVEADANVQASNDANFRQFWARLVLSALNPLKAAAAAVSRPLEDLTVAQVIAHFEAVAKQDLSH
jgi:hypothetical protein